jgi:hypothetical protein
LSFIIDSSDVVVVTTAADKANRSANLKTAWRWSREDLFLLQQTFGTWNQSLLFPCLFFC